MEELLNISEAARLMGVCQNTLRDWDVEHKFQAVKTVGGHRRYSLTAIREYLDKHPVEIETKNEAVSKKKEMLHHWEQSGFIDWCNEKEKPILAQLLQNAADFDKIECGSIFSSTQIYWLISEGWRRSRLRKIVSVDAMSRPCDSTFFAVAMENGNIKLESAPVVAKTQKYEFKMFTEANFYAIRNLYADAMASEIDYIILKELHKTKCCDIETILDATKIGDIELPYEYIAAPKDTIEILRSRNVLKTIDLIESPTILDENKFVPMAIGGLYDTSNLSTPKFLPYMLWIITPAVHDQKTSSVLLRYGWFSGGNEVVGED